MKNYVLDGDQVKRLLYDDCYKNDPDNLVDISTQEVFDLYDGSTLLYQRDKTVNNLYKVWGELKQIEVEGLSQMSILYIFHNDNIVLPSGKYLTLRVATDLLTELNTGMGPHYKFNIEQWDAPGTWDNSHTPSDSRGRTFWYTVLNWLEGMTITHDSHMYRLFKNARGLSAYSSHKLVLTFGNDITSGFNFQDAFSNSDIQQLKIQYNGVAAATRRGITTFKKAFIGVNASLIECASNVTVDDITEAFKDSKIQVLTINLVNVDKGLTKPTIKCYNAFENAIRWATRSTNPGKGVDFDSITFVEDTTSLFGWGGDATIRPHLDTIKMFNNAKYLFIGNTSDFANNTNIIDMQFVDPTRDNEYTDGRKFFGTYIQSVKIANLNKGNWRIECPLNNNSVNYLLNNIFDLTSNINNRHLIPTDFNLFKNWKFYQCSNNGLTSFPLYYRVGNNAGSVTIPAFTAEELNEVSLDPYAAWSAGDNDVEGYTGEMKLSFKYFYPNGAGQNNQNLDLELVCYGDNNLILFDQIIQNVTPNQVVTFDFTQRNRNTSLVNNYIQDEEIQDFILLIRAANHQQIDNVDITIQAAAGHEYSTVESATLQFTEVNDNSAFNSAKAVAQSRGWTIQFAS